MLHLPGRHHPVPLTRGLLEETMLSMIQLLIARHPELLAAPEELDPLVATPPLHAAHRILDALREVTEALDDYRNVLERTSGAHDKTQP
jgi:hypothetical protein